MPPYDARFAIGATVRICSAQVLRDFQREWRYHNKLQDEQIAHAGETATVTNVAYYHGGDALYDLYKVPGTWHEQCLEQKAVSEAPADFSMIDFLNQQNKRTGGADTT